jgi:uncharacterized protein (TIGR02284 family)
MEWHDFVILIPKYTTMTNNEKLVEALNDLIKINNDRIEGYEKAARETDDADLNAAFLKMADQSDTFKRELADQIADLGGEEATDTTVSGKIYRVWMDIKNTFTGGSRKSVLEVCEFGEDAAQKAYNEALNTDAEMSAELRQFILAQKADLKTSHDLIKEYRDLQKA